MRPVFCIAFALLLAALAVPAYAAEPDAPDALIGRSEAIHIAIQDRLSEKFTSASEVRKEEQGALVEYYAVPENRLLWVDENGLTNRAKSVMDEIRKADDYGLRASDYALPKAPSADNGAPDTKRLADAEIKLSFAVMRYARDARGGRIDPERLTPNLDPTLALPDPLEVIESISFRSDPAAYLRSFQPDQPQFEALRQALIEARGGKSAETDVVRIPEGPLLKVGMDDEQVTLLRKRLELPADNGAKETVFDDSLEAAVKGFQATHGAYPDGLVGPGTRSLLNQQHHAAASPSRERLILLNMERWRWLPHDLGSYYVNVNIPEFMLRVMKEGKPDFTTRVVVGKPEKQTPVFSNEMQTIVFNPYWNVPNSIKTEEIRPYLVEEGGWFGGGGWNTAVLQRHNLRINVGGREIDPSRIDWNRIDIRSLNIYQPPGPDNVLGNVKFLFPNKHDVYMHDTPQKFLFARPVRAESHGCMRVQNPDQLALTLLKEDQGWTAGRVASAIQSGSDQQIPLRQKIPVYITYFTLKVNDDGSMSTFGDLYGHDARMAAALRL